MSSAAPGSWHQYNVGIGFKRDNQVRLPVEFLPQFTNDSAEQEQPLRDCPSQRFNKPDSHHNLFIVSWITRVIYKYLLKRNRNRLARGFKSQTKKSYGKGHNTTELSRVHPPSPTHTSQL
ncbi:hypothetical protein T4D_15796 [Trichinella pseudospiralis]|uniref:Uncharacterized protein n=1 Tax=Trichinella pseudospiralis TaxID=6337 RepID=A0A0V1EY86_TRIPS|nr:hypothetical protein T4D_15796 [Trichinella pseudospiralis]